MTEPRTDEVLLSDDARETLSSLETSRDPSRQAIARRAREYGRVLLRDCLHGEVVKQTRIPERLRNRYGASNLYVEDLPSFWWLLYSVTKYRGRRYVLVLAIVDHRTYSQWFRGRHR